MGLQEQGGTVPAFMLWAVPVQVTTGTEATAAATVTPKTINRLTDKDADGNIIKQLTITDPTVHFTGDGTRSMRIVKVASDGTETEVYPRTLIQNGTNGTIITENYTEGKTTVQVSHNFTDETTYPKGTYKVELYLTGTATKPVATGNIVIAERPLKLVFFHDDHLGTPRLITDEDGQTVSKHDYLAYGEEITTADFQTNRMKFTGHERDPETGLDYMLARYYTSGSGRFLQVDPGHDYDMADPMSFNLYGYVRGNPVMGTDPTGMNGAWDYFKGICSAALGVGVGFVQGAGETVVGTVKVIIHMDQANRNIEQAAMHPIKTGKAIGKSVKKSFAEAQKSNYKMGKFVGKGLFFVALTAAPFAEARGAVEAADATAGAAEGGSGEVQGPVTLSDAQSANVRRFTKKVPANAKASTELHPLPNDGVAAQATSPGKVPGSSAVYEKQIDASGKTIQYTKTTYDNKGKLVHVKDKM